MTMSQSERKRVDLAFTHEDTSSTLSRGTFTTQTLDSAIGVNLVVFQYGHLDFLALMLDLLRGLKEYEL